MKKLAIIGGGYMAGIFAKNARTMGVESHCFSLINGVVDESLFDFVHPINILEKERVLDICRDICIDGVVATTELTISVAAFVADKLGLIGIPPNVADVITDKYRNRLATKSVDGLLHPRYSDIYSIQDFQTINCNYPIILKPTSKGGKRGITVINSKKEVNKGFNYALNGAGGQLPLIAEEFIEGGMECSVESLSFRGNNYIIQITEKITSGPPHCVELAHHQPARLSEDDRRQIESVMNRALTAVGLVNGACHTEIKIKNGEIYLIEFNARPGGDHIAYPLTELSTGYPYIKGAIDIALNQFSAIDVSTFKNKCAGVLFVTQQTKKLKPLFDRCQEYEWFYKKNLKSEELQNIDHNDGFNINYFMYLSDKRPQFDVLLNEVTSLNC